ncbi:MAG TPA: permease [Anaerolineae bacterium]
MSRKKLLSFVILILLILLGTFALDNILPVLSGAPALSLPDLAQTYVTTFLGIFIEAAPFLLLGSLASGAIAVFISADDIARVIPRNPVLATVIGALLGMIFPVCECGVVPVVRRLYQKGLPISAGIAFLLGAPVLNPVVIASTYAAFGFSTIFWSRLGFTFVVAVAIGLVFNAQPSLLRVLRPGTLAPIMGGSTDIIPSSAIKVQNFSDRLQRSFSIAADEFFDMGRYLVVGSLIATTLQTMVPQQLLVGIGASPVTSVVALCLLAFVLSVCSTVDAFLALSFVNTFTSGAIIAFLVFGPMVDIKSTLMFLGVFRRRVVLYLVLLPFLAAVVIGLAINLNLGW